MTSPSEDIAEQLRQTAKCEAVSLGTVVRGRYQIISYLGRGGMSTVYKALDMRGARTVALKILHTELLSDTTRVQRFMQEAKTYRDLTHSHIVKTYDFFTDEESRYCLVMEFHEGRNLAQVLAENGKLSVRRAVKVFSEICDALDHAHSRGIVHRDLKPSNIALVEKEKDSDYVRVLDFGIAKMMPQDDETHLSLTQTGEIVGSPLYMSPEQCMAKPVDHRSDIYSLGCLMYESLVGQPPLMGGNVYETFHMQTHERPKSLGDIREEFKSGTYFEFIIFKCMAKNPKHRYQTMMQVKEALSKVGMFSQKSAIQTVVDRWSERQVKKRAEHGKHIPWYVSVSATVLIIGIGLFLCKDTIMTMITKPDVRYSQAVTQYTDAFTIGDYKKAEESAQLAINIAEKELPNLLQSALLNLVDLYRIEGRSQEAKLLDKRASLIDQREEKLARKTEDKLLAKVKAVARETPDDTVQIEDFCIQLTDLAESYIEDGKVDQAIALLNKVLKLTKTYLPENNAIAANANDSLAVMSLRNNLNESYDDIEKKLTEAVTARENTSGKESPGLIQTLGALSEVQRRRGDFAHAKESAQRALSIARSVYRSTSIQAAQARCQIAEIDLGMNRPAAATAAVSTALTAMDEQKDYASQARCYVILGEANLAKDKYSEAQKDFDKASGLVKDSTNVGLLTYSRALSGLGDVYSFQKDNVRAEGCFKRAIARMFRSRAREEARVAGLLDKLHTNYREQGKEEQIVKLYQAVEATDKVTGKVNGVIEDRQLLAAYYLEKREYRKACSYLEKALEQAQQLYGSESAKRCEVMGLLAAAYMKDKDYQKAAPLIDEADKLMHSENLKGTITRKVKLQILSTLIRYLERSNSLERLQKVKEELEQV